MDQLDIFDALGEKPPPPPFTVWIGPGSIQAANKCGYCGRGGYYGGGCGPARGDKPNYAYAYCSACVEKHGHPKHWAPNWVLVQAQETETQ